MSPGRSVLSAVGILGLGCFGYGTLIEPRSFRLRRCEVPILPTGSPDIRVLQITDLHMTPGARARQEWVSRLAGLEPDLVINTGDNLSHPEAVPHVLRSLGRLLGVPGVFVWGSNDYYAPALKNPFDYFAGPSKIDVEKRRLLPWRDLGAAFTDAGWHDLTHRRLTLTVKGIPIGFRGTDDAHLKLDRYPLVAGPIDRSETPVALGITHAPYRRVIDPMTADGHDLIVAGHTHGGQVCVPGYGALVSNCDLSPRKAKGLSAYAAGGRNTRLHVSAGLGTSPFAPFRFACPPEATLLTLTAA